MAVSVLSSAKPLRAAEATQVKILNNTYHQSSIKSSSRNKGGETSRKVHLESVELKMLQPWADFFNDGENKENLIRRASSLCRSESEEGRSLLKILVAINCKWETSMIQRDRLEELPTCNQEEADAWLVLHVANGTTPVLLLLRIRMFLFCLFMA